MSPGGHLVTTVAACAASVVLTRNLPMADTVALAGGIAAGGFLIDVDHAIDYVFVEGQRDLRPSAFLNYYVEGRMRRTVLALHSYELFAVLVQRRADSAEHCRLLQLHVSSGAPVRSGRVAGPDRFEAPVGLLGHVLQRGAAHTRHGRHDGRGDDAARIARPPGDVLD